MQDCCYLQNISNEDTAALPLVVDIKQNNCKILSTTFLAAAKNTEIT